MNKNFAKIPENAESKAVDREKEEYPVQQVAVTYPIGTSWIRRKPRARRSTRRRSRSKPRIGEMCIRDSRDHGTNRRTAP